MFTGDLRSSSLTQQSRARLERSYLGTSLVAVPSDQAFPCLHFDDIQQSQDSCFVI